jgi:hypothetical protein
MLVLSETQNKQRGHFMKHVKKQIAGLSVTSLVLCMGLSLGSASAADSFQIAQSDPNSITSATNPMNSGVNGVGSPSSSYVNAPEVMPNPVNPNSGQSSYRTTSPSSNRATNTRPFPETRGRTNMFYESSKPGIVGSSANEGVRQPTTYNTVPGNAPTTAVSRSTGGNPSNQVSPAPVNISVPAPAATPATQTTTVTVTQASPEVLAPPVLPPTRIEIHGSDGGTSVNVNAEGSPPVYADEAAAQALMAEERTTIVDNNDNDDNHVPITNLVLWSLLSVCLMGLAAFATYLVIKRREDNRLSDF